MIKSEYINKKHYIKPTISIEDIWEDAPLLAGSPTTGEQEGESTDGQGDSDEGKMNDFVVWDDNDVAPSY